MARRTPMQRLARWHIWLGWAVAIPVLLWMVSGLFMALRPIEEVRGNHLRIEAQEEVLSAATGITLPTLERPARSLSVAMQDGRPVVKAEFADGSLARFDAGGKPLPPLDEAAARALVAKRIKGGDRAESAALFAADKVPFDFRRPMPVWQVVLADGTHVYVGRDSGAIEAVRTRWWRVYDFLWGLHILDPATREDTSHPLLIAAAALGLIGSVLGSILLFRRRRARA